MLFNFCWIPKRNNHSLLLTPPTPNADALGGIMCEGCVPCRPPTAQGRVPPAHVCMADCIKHKQLYLIGLYPALITTNSQSLRTALLALATLQNKQGKSHSSVILQRERDDVSEGTMAVLMVKQDMRFAFAIFTSISCNTDCDGVTMLKGCSHCYGTAGRNEWPGFAQCLCSVNTETRVLSWFYTCSAELKIFFRHDPVWCPFAVICRNVNTV